MTPTRETRTISFSTVTVDETGKIMAEQLCSARVTTETLGEGVDLDLVLIPAGLGLIGSPPGEGYPDETPRHEVAFPSFWMSRFLITQRQWTAVMGSNPSRFKGEERPVDGISRDAAARFCTRLSELAGRRFELPSEAMWEYACRAGTQTPFSWGETITTEVANYEGLFTYYKEPAGVYRHETTPAGTFPPNLFGLYDMHGNLWEWCADPWHDSYDGAPADGSVWLTGGDSIYGVVRGGSWHDIPAVCRSACRLKVNRANGDETIGFRVICTAEEIVNG